MNRRYNISDIRVVKKETKEIKKGMKKDTLLEKKNIAAKKALAETPKHYKKISKRTSPSENIENSSPSHLCQEGKRWISTLKTQQATKTIRMNRKGSKYKG